MKWSDRKIRRTWIRTEKLITTIQRIILRNKTINTDVSLHTYQATALSNLLDKIQIAFREFTEKVS